MGRRRWVLGALASLAAVLSGGPANAYEVTRVISQPEEHDASGKITVEASVIHVVACNGPAENGGEFFIYQYSNRPGYRAIRPPEWSSPLGGRDVDTYDEAVGIACGTASAGAPASPSPTTPPAPPLGPTPGPSTPADAVSMPSFLSVTHTAKSTMPLALNLTRREGNRGTYEGNDYDGDRVIGTADVFPDGTIQMRIEIPAKGYVGTYSGTRSGNRLEGRYEPSPGFGSPDVFRADLGEPAA